MDHRIQRNGIDVSGTPPETVTIGHLNYRITFDDALINEYSVREGGNFAGYSNAAEQVIVLASKSHSGMQAGDDYVREVLLHEILHQCLRVTGTNPDWDAKAGVTDVEERTVAAMAGPLLAVLRNNRDLLTYVLDAAPSYDAGQVD